MFSSGGFFALKSNRARALIFRGQKKFFQLTAVLTGALSSIRENKIGRRKPCRRITACPEPAAGRTLCAIKLRGS